MGHTSRRGEGGSKWVQLMAVLNVFFPRSFGLLASFLISHYVLLPVELEEFCDFPPPSLNNVIVVRGRGPTTHGPYIGVSGFTYDVPVCIDRTCILVFRSRSTS